MNGRSLRALALLLACFELAGMAALPQAVASSQPLANAQVQAQVNGGFSIVSSALTDGSGGYVINQSITPGLYDVGAKDVGYLGSTQTVNVTSTGEVVTANFNLSRSALVWGRVLGFDGNPVVGAIATLYDSDSGIGVANTYTDSNGSYYFYDGVSTGTYYVGVDFQFPSEYGGSLVLLGGNYSEPDFSYVDAPMGIPGYVGAQSGNVTAVTGSSVQVPELTLARSGLIAGSVTDTLGHSIANASLQVTSQAFPSHIYVTNATGQFAISYDVVTDNYTITPYAFGYIGGSSVVSASSGGTVNVTIQMSPSAIVLGRVIRLSDGTPIPGAFVSLTSQDGLYDQVSITGADGRYSIPTGLGPDTYILTLVLGTQVISNSTISLTTGQSATVDFTADVFFVTGTVHANSTAGAGVAGADVSLTYSGPPGSAAYASTDDIGAFKLVIPVANGTRGEVALATLTASAAGFNVTSVSVNLTMGTDSSQDVVLVPSPTGVSGGPSATITGEVTGNDGPALPFTSVWWHVVDGNSTYEVGFNSSSDVLYATGSSQTDQLSFIAAGPGGTIGQATVYLPSSFFVGPFAATSSPGPDPNIISQSSQGSEYVVTLTFGQSTHVITLMKASPVPEFPGPAALAAAAASVAVAMLYERAVRKETPAVRGGLLHSKSTL